ncbi:MAG: hypothetical protein HOP02_08675 [Methylococcaceae bacterium]|nr:hypothetical protein [Methylococcaceae bacterium]
MDTSKGRDTSLRHLCGAVLLTHASFSVADFHGTLTATTNNADRWFSKSDNNIALQANIDYEHRTGGYIGSSVSNVDYPSNDANNAAAHVEIMPYAGWSFKLPKQWRLDVQWSAYLFDGEVFGHNADYHELYVFLHYQDLLTARIAVANDYYGLGNYAIDYALTGRYPLTDALQLSATAGYSQTHTAVGADYPYWNINLAYAYKWLTFAVHYMDASETNIDEAVEDKIHAFYDPPMLNKAFIFSISVGF